MSRAVSKTSASTCLRSVDCNGFVEDDARTDIVFEVTDRPKYLFTCGLCGVELVVKRLMDYNCGAWTIECPMKDACGDDMLITDDQNDQVILMPGHYKIEVNNCPGEEFPEEFTHELYGIEFDFAKCWLAARAG